jgi:hypothetical protein
MFRKPCLRPVIRYLTMLLSPLARTVPGLRRMLLFSAKLIIQNLFPFVSALTWSKGFLKGNTDVSLCAVCDLWTWVRS